ncbi:thiol reductant ABC exporter subunit CydC [Aquibacillus kalidii]|uniref:thiol reductant ABC exporter subunit CydC n=1 Tax=Aquibacillus kalidii TaxID=2762597 RepID=UPI001648312B|nr:thiol reductant ABC exporter subunit CydC [Aquibacillus kalidii]
MKTWLIPYVKLHYKGLLLSIFLGLFALFCGSALMFTSGFLISKSALRPENILMVYVPIVGVRTFGISRAVIQYLSRLSSHHTILGILSDMRGKLYRVLELQAAFLHSRLKTGSVLGVLVDDIDHLQDLFIRTILPSIVSLGMYATVVLSLGWFDWTFAILIACYVFLLVILIPIASLAYLRISLKFIKKDRNIQYQELTDSTLGIRDWMVTGRQSELINQSQVKDQIVTRLEAKAKKVKRLRDFISQLVIGAIVISMVYWSSGMVGSDRLSVTMIAAFVLVTISISEAFLPVSDAIEKLPEYSDSIHRLKQLEEHIGEDDNHEYQTLSNNNMLINLKDVFFKYPDSERFVLNGIDLTISQGEKIAILGRSGAGKSSIVQLITGVRGATQGQVEINGYSPQAIGDSLFEKISVLNQRPHLFNTTIYNNIRLANQNAAAEEVYEVARKVGLYDYIMTLPKGFDTHMSESGSIFSGGQQQRIALARTLLKGSSVVILDEPTVGLDPETESALLTTIFTALQDKTLIWITHHLTGVQKMDEVIFLEDGKIVMRGSHQELMKKDARYRGLYYLDVPKSVRKYLSGI